MFKLLPKAGMFVVLSLTFASLIPAQPRRYMHENHMMRFEMLDVNKDKRIDQKEWQIHFRDIDKNGDGFISAEEMDQHQEMMMQKMDERRPGPGPRR